MTYTIPGHHATGDLGHTTDHNNIIDVLTGIGAVANILNTAWAGGADPTGAADSTAAIQAAWDSGLPAYHPPGKYLITSPLQWSSGLVALGAFAGTYPGEDTIPGVTYFTRAAHTNTDVIQVPDGTNYGRISDIAIDGNKNNNTSGIGMNIEDGASGQETQIIIERCFFHDNPNSNLYLGNNRRANKVQYGVFNYSGAGDGITACGSDNLIMSNICGSNARAGINLGSTITQNWAAFGSGLNSTTTHVFNNDIYQNDVGIAVPANATRSLIIGNGIDRNNFQGITVYNGDCNAIIGNALHSNGQAADNTYGHIDLAAGVTGVTIEANTFGPIDGGITNYCSYCVVTEAGIGSGVINGGIGNYDASDTHGGLLSTAGGNSSPSVLLSRGGAIIQGNNTTQHPFQVRNAAGSSLFDIDNAGTFSVNDGQGKFLATVFIGETAAPGSTPSGGGILYVDNTGHLHYLGPGGTDTTLAGP